MGAMSIKLSISTDQMITTDDMVHYNLISSTSMLFVHRVCVCVCVYVVPYGNYGCSGGNVFNTFTYVIANAGVDTEGSYPYIGRVSSYNMVDNSNNRTSGFPCLTSIYCPGPPSTFKL